MSFAGLIVGLGNPGRQYEETRHNMGFLTIDALLREARAVSPLSGGKFRCDLWKIDLPPPQAGGTGRGRQVARPAFSASPDSWLLAKPHTFMNLSGESVQPLAAWHRITADRILVVHDEMDLPPGRMKFRKGGGAAGHNGLKSISERLGTPDFYRLRLGTGRSPHGGADTVNWVLGRPDAEERAAFEQMLPAALQVIFLFAAGDMEAAARQANGYRAE